MPSAQSFHRSLKTLLTGNTGQSSLTLSLLLIGLEILIESHLSCPCSYGWNIGLIALIFVGPFGLILLIMCFLLRPCQHKCWCFRSKNLSSDEKNYLKALGHCLIPPVVWIIILFIDGDYVACGATQWEGNYVFDKELNRMWCQPTQLNHTENMSNLQHEYLLFITKSQVTGYSLMTFSFIIIICLCCYDSKKRSQNQPPDRPVESTQTSTPAPDEFAPPSTSTIVQNPTTHDEPEESTTLNTSTIVQNPTSHNEPEESIPFITSTIVQNPTSHNEPEESIPLNTSTIVQNPTSHNEPEESTPLAHP